MHKSVIFHINVIFHVNVNFHIKIRFLSDICHFNISLSSFTLIIYIFHSCVCFLWHKCHLSHKMYHLSHRDVWSFTVIIITWQDDLTNDLTQRFDKFHTGICHLPDWDLFTFTERFLIWHWDLSYFTIQSVILHTEIYHFLH